MGGKSSGKKKHYMATQPSTDFPPKPFRKWCRTRKPGLKIRSRDGRILV